MKQHLVKHSYAAIIALLIALFALPVQAQSIAKPASQEQQWRNVDSRQQKQEGISQILRNASFV